MFFIRVGKFIAWASVIIGGSGAIIGLFLAFGAENPPAASRAIMGSDPLGEEINQRLMLFVAGVVIGLLSEIAERLGAEDNTAVDGVPPLTPTDN